jgi:hypothetical protein
MPHNRGGQEETETRLNEPLRPASARSIAARRIPEQGSLLKFGSGVLSYSCLIVA